MTYLGENIVVPHMLIRPRVQPAGTAKTKPTVDLLTLTQTKRGKTQVTHDSEGPQLANMLNRQ